MIGTFEVKTAINRLSAAGFGTPRDPAGTLEEWERVLRAPQLDCQPAELSEAVTRFIRKTEKTYGFPPPALIRTEILARRPAPPVDPWGPKEPGAIEAFKEAFNRTNRGGETYDECVARVRGEG